MILLLCDEIWFVFLKSFQSRAYCSQLSLHEELLYFVYSFGMFIFDDVPFLLQLVYF